MRKYMRIRHAYYSVYAAPDGTIVMALPTRKPSKQSFERGPVVDDDGCHGWHEWDESIPRYSSWARGVVRGAVENNLNLKKTLRAQIEPRLARIEATLDQVLAKLNVLLPSKAKPTSPETIATTPTPRSKRSPKARARR